MITLAPCPICNRTPKVYEWKTGWTISCVGDRHTLAVSADEIQHDASLYRGRSQDEVVEAWNKAFGRVAA